MCRIDYGLDNVGLSTLHLLVHCTEYSRYWVVFRTLYTVQSTEDTG